MFSFNGNGFETLVTCTLHFAWLMILYLSFFSFFFFFFFLMAVLHTIFRSSYVCLFFSFSCYVFVCFVLFVCFLQLLMEFSDLIAQKGVPKGLRVRAVFHKTVRVCHVYCNLKISFKCRITVIFGTLKDGSPLINTLASNICFSYRNMFQNGVDALSKIVDAFLSKSAKFYVVLIIW